MKDYLKDSLSNEEERYIYGIINKTVLKYFRESDNKIENGSISIDDENFPEELLAIDDKYNLVNKILDTKILRDICALKPYSQYEKEKIVETLDSMASELGLSMFIKPLTFNEKLVVFLFYIENYQVNEVATLLNISRIAVWKRDKSIKNKIQNVKEKLENERYEI